MDNAAHEIGNIEEKDIGVINDSRLEFYKHINQKIKKQAVSWQLIGLLQS